MTGPALLLAALAAGLGGCLGRAERPAADAPPVAACPPGTWAVGERCLTSQEAFVGTDGRQFVVDGLKGDDGNDGRLESPWRTLGRATRPGTLRPGDAVMIREGVYRETITPRTGGTGPDARITFAAWPGERVVVTGADLADDGWRRTPDGAWRRAWTGPGLNSYSDDPVFRRELVVAGGAVLMPVATRDSLAPGRFWAEGPDTHPAAIVARFPGDAAPADAGPVEIAVRTRLFWPEGPDPYADCGDPATPGWLRVVGLTFRHAANRAQWGAVCAGSHDGLIESVEVEWTNGLGIDVSGRGHTFRQSRADLNGQMGWGGACTGCLVDGCAAVGNNWKDYDPFWEAGGGKWVRTSDTVIRQFYTAWNGGPGLWLDIDNRRNTVEGTLAVGNEVAGIMVELRSTETLVQHNVIAQTRWREWSGTGLLSQAASRNAYLHNTAVENEGTGLWLRLDPLRRAPDGLNTVENNRLVGNATLGREAREIQVEGLSPAHVRSSRFAGNAYGRLGDGTLRSTFFVSPAPDVSEAGFRGDDLEVWRLLTGEAARLVSADASVRAVAAGRVSVGAARAPVVPYDRVGADPAQVRARGDWRRAPAAPRWPR